MSTKTNIFFTSDTHFGHENIINLSGRPFSSAEEMNETMIDNWNSVVGKEDEVWFLGDFAMGKIAETLPIGLRLNGVKFLVPGNHDRCWNGHSKKNKVAQAKINYEAAGFIVLPGQLFLNFGGREFKVCHFPYSGDSQEEDRYTDHRPVDQGIPLLHGHVHEKWKFNGNMINVGVDVWNYTPTNIETILEEWRNG